MSLGKSGRITRSMGGASSRVDLRPVRLLVLEGPDRGHECTLEPGKRTVGSGSGCDLRLSDDTVSRSHAVLEHLGTRVRVRDLGSKNGTRYLGARVDSVVVPVGSSLEFGATRVALLPLQAGPGELSARTELAGLLGQSVPMRRLFADLERVARTDAACLVEGESGTGKEQVSRALHALSARASGPLQCFDCSSVAPTLVHSELFGHVKGAFTGAHADRMGVLEAANGGTLVLDEMAELPKALQPLLLRAVETHKFSRLGEQRTREVDFRLVCITQRDLASEVASGRFRADLYHRLPSITLRVPPLRDRREDIPLLVAHFARELDPHFEMTRAELAALMAHPWPGNVRELRNAVERHVTLRRGDVESVSQAPPEEDFTQARDKALRSFEKGYLASLLATHGGSAAAAARASGLARSYFYKLLALHGLKGTR